MPCERSFQIILNAIKKHNFKKNKIARRENIYRKFRTFGKRLQGNDGQLRVTLQGYWQQGFQKKSTKASRKSWSTKLKNKLNKKKEKKEKHGTSLRSLLHGEWRTHLSEDEEQDACYEARVQEQCRK